jgi:hypothetical protein
VVLTSRSLAAVGFGSCLLVLAGFVTTRQGQQNGDRAQQIAAAHVADPLVAELADETRRLQRGLATVTAAPRLARNPFEATEAPRLASAFSVREVATPSLEVPAAVPPDLTLLGVAEDNEDGVVVRTAVIGGPGDELYFVKPEGLIGQRYRVTRISSEAAEIVDVGSQTIYALVLK